MTAPLLLTSMDASAGALTITFNNTKRANALSANMVSMLLKALDDAENDVSVRVVILTGAGKYFCSGMDLAAASASDSSTPFASSLQLFQRIATFPKPTIARLNGAALGGGVGIAFCCDLRVMHEEAYLQLAEVRRGLIPAIISLVIVPEIGPAMARRWFMTGERVTGKDNKVLLDHSGFAVVPGDSLDKEVLSLAATLAEGGPRALREIKDLVRAVAPASGNSSKEKVDYVQRAFEAMLKSEEAAHGMAAFIQKKKPDWVVSAGGASKL